MCVPWELILILPLGFWGWNIRLKGLVPLPTDLLRHPMSTFENPTLWIFIIELFWTKLRQVSLSSAAQVVERPGCGVSVSCYSVLNGAEGASDKCFPTQDFICFSLLFSLKHPEGSHDYHCHKSEQGEQSPTMRK